MIEDLQRELQMDSQAMSTIIKVMERDVVRGVGEEREGEVGDEEGRGQGTHTLSLSVFYFVPSTFSCFCFCFLNIDSRRLGY